VGDRVISEDQAGQTDRADSEGQVDHAVLADRAGRVVSGDQVVSESRVGRAGLVVHRRNRPLS